jgi:hypothetical protein
MFASSRFYPETPSADDILPQLMYASSRFYPLTPSDDDILAQLMCVSSRFYPQTPSADDILPQLMYASSRFYPPTPSDDDILAQLVLAGAEALASLQMISRYVFEGAEGVHVGPVARVDVDTVPVPLSQLLLNLLQIRERIRVVLIIFAIAMIIF